MHDKFAGVETLPLFDAPPAQPTGRGETQRSTAPYARGKCPRCRHDLVAMVSDGRCLTWKRHTLYRTTGPSTVCSASGEKLHDLPPRDGKYVLATVRDGGPNTRPYTCHRGDL
jgi:hypothetical protein